MNTKVLKGYLIFLLLLLSAFTYADDYKWYLVTNRGQMIEMSRVFMLVATDTEDTFSILDSQGNILANGVSEITFENSDPTGIKASPVKGNILESVVDNVLTLIGFEGNVEVFSVDGVKMLTVKATQRETHINVAHFMSGVYIVKCGKQTFKFNKK